MRHKPGDATTFKLWCICEFETERVRLVLPHENRYKPYTLVNKKINKNSPQISRDGGSA